MKRWIGLGMLAISMLATNACQSANTSAAANALVPCEIALTEHNGDGKLDQEIRQIQQKIRGGQNNQRQNDQLTLPLIEKLGWSYVEKARGSFDPGYYKLAEQCAACMDAKRAAFQTTAQASPAAKVSWNEQSAQSAKASALLLRGHVLDSLHRFADAEQIARELVQTRGMAFDYGLLGDVLMEQGKLDDAILAYQKMMELKPGPQAYSRAAHVHWLKGDTEGARMLMRMSAQSAGQGDAEASAWAWSKVAIYELQAGSLKQAQATCDMALDIKPGYAPALLARGRVMLAEYKFDEAIPTLQRAAEFNPLPEYQWTLAEALRAAHRDDEAKVVEATLNQRGPNDDPRTFAIYLATRGEQPSKALQLAEEELKNRHDVYTLDALAWAQSNAGNHQQAWETMQSALATGTQDARLFFHAAAIAAKSGQTIKARQYAKQALPLQMVLLPSEREHLRQLKT